MPTAVIYVRVSTEEQVSNLSLDTQEAACRAYAARQGLDVARVYREEGESAKTMARPALQRMLADLERGRIKPASLVVYDLSRLARETLDHLLIRRQLRELGINLRAATQHVDETPEGELMETLLAAIARWDNAARSRRVLAGMRAAAERGRWVWKAPPGYRHRGESLGIEPDPDQAPILRRAFARVASRSWTVESARREAAAEGLAVPHSTWYALLQNPIYRGRLVSPAWNLDVAGSHEPLVDAVTWSAVQSALAREGEKRAYVAGGTPTFPLKGLVRCGCGRRMTGEVVKRWAYYRCPAASCRGSVRVERMEAALLELLAGLAVPGEVVELFGEILAARYGVEARERAELAERARRRLQAAEARHQRLLDLVTDGALDAEDFRRQAARVAAEREAAEVALGSCYPTSQPTFQLALELGRELLTRPAEAYQRVPAARRPQWVRVVFPSGLSWDGSGLSNSGRCLLDLPFPENSGEFVRVGTPSHDESQPLGPWLQRLSEASALASLS